MGVVGGFSVNILVARERALRLVIARVRGLFPVKPEFFQLLFQQLRFAHSTAMITFSFPMLVVSQ